MSPSSKPLAAAPLTPEQRKQVAARVEFYRDLGIYDLYRQQVAAPAAHLAGESLSASELTGQGRNSSPPAAAEAQAPSLRVLSDPAAELAAIAADMGDCRLCRLHQGRTNLVFGAGNPQAELVFIGEGPGADEDAQGLPFVGRAGQLLNNMIVAMGLRREDVYICNVVKCRPPQNRTPEKDEAETCMPFLMRQVSAIRPRAIVALGATAAKNLLGLNDTMANLRSRTYEFTPPGYSGDAIKLFVSFHPAYL
ncbi:MAG TPA: uracil-DNA glycosylase, partial [Terriglobales bacterium]|nr:uracil-DNA glycosylase [Terriglobales bacterium]